MKKLLLYVILTLIAFLMLSPLLWMVSTSLSKDSVIVSTSLIPKEFTLENYVKAWNFPRIFNKDITFGTFFLNSIIVTVCLVIGGLFLTRWRDMFLLERISREELCFSMLPL